MAFIPVPDVAETVLMHALAGQNVFNVINWLFPDTPGIPELHILTTEVMNAWDTHLASLMASAVALEAIRATDLSSATATSILTPMGGAHNGTGTGVSTSNNVALCLTCGTDLRGRSYRGRVYQAGIPATGIYDSSHVTEAYQDYFVDGWIAFFTAVENAADVDHVIVSRFTDNAPRVTGVATEVTNYGANLELDSMRRRLAGRGS